MAALPGICKSGPEEGSHGHKRADFVNNGPVNRAQDAGPHEQDRSLHNDMEEEDEQ
ncbi:hypothetical protein SAY87_013743 [Trapa incisa]|uniref:Uncharacterized protein n=1 Tax=Trapa incisa TaxID=236973 RepID=A0AAN7KJY1_9MYRT|nr:hypothetical protein SAY87_013743 [Trapa incisa]